jgi:hypothetical protein
MVCLTRPNPQIPSARRAFGFVCLLLVTDSASVCHGEAALPMCAANTSPRWLHRPTLEESNLLALAGGRRGGPPLLRVVTWELGSNPCPVRSSDVTTHESRLLSALTASSHSIMLGNLQGKLLALRLQRIQPSTAAGYRHGPSPRPLHGLPCYFPRYPNIDGTLVPDVLGLLL